MNNTAAQRALIFSGVVVFLTIAFTASPGKCLEQDAAIPSPQAGQRPAERVNKEDNNLSSSGTTVAAEPVGSQVEGQEDVLVRKDDGSILKGKDLYNKLCAKCHDAYSTKGTTGPGMQGVLKNEFLPSSNKPATVRNILSQLDNPRGAMPSFHFLGEEEKLLIIAFLNTL